MFMFFIINDLNLPLIQSFKPIQNKEHKHLFQIEVITNKEAGITNPQSVKDRNRGFEKIFFSINLLLWVPIQNKPDNKNSLVAYLRKLDIPSEGERKKFSKTAHPKKNYKKR